jgi:hypothetical protein
MSVRHHDCGKVHRVRSVTMKSVLACVLVTVSLAGCGGDTLTAEEQTMVADAQLAFSGLVLDGRYQSEADEGVRDLIALYREKPDAEYDGLTMGEVLQDAASTLDEFQPDLAAELDRAAER